MNPIFGIPWNPSRSLTKIAPEKLPKPNRKPDRLPTINFQGRAVKLRGGETLFKAKITYKLGCHCNPCLDGMPAEWRDFLRTSRFASKMEEIRRPPIEVGSLSHYLQGFFTSQVGCLGCLPSTVSWKSSWGFDDLRCQHSHPGPKKNHAYRATNVWPALSFRRQFWVSTRWAPTSL